MELASKIKGGRAILGWTRDDLAERSGLSAPGIRLIEQGGSPNVRSQNKIIRAFEKQGLIFLETGIELRECPVYFTHGKNHEEAYLKLLDDVSEHLHGMQNPELLIMNSDDRLSSPTVNNRYRELRARGVRMRQLIQDGNSYIIGPLSEYRCIPQKLFINRVTLIYGDCIANETSDTCRGVIKIDPVAADIQKNLFEILWSTLPQPKETIADEIFE